MFAIVHVVFIQSYGLGGEHYCMFIVTGHIRIFYKKFLIGLALVVVLF